LHGVRAGTFYPAVGIVLFILGTVMSFMLAAFGAIGLV
jgi:hypothetical protein